MVKLAVSFGVLLLAALFIMVASLMISTRQVHPIPDPFVLYTNLLTGKLQAGFVCRDATVINDETKPGAFRQMCTAYLSDGVFSQVRVIRATEVNLYQVSFVLHSQRLTVGDLAMLWGRPSRGSASNERMSLQWPSHGVTAIVQVRGLFSYYLPVDEIVFTHKDDIGTLAPTSL